MRGDLAPAYLLNALWQLPLLLVVGVAGERVLARAPAAWRHAVWLVVVAAGSLLPALGTIGAGLVVAPVAMLAGGRGATAPPDPRWLAEWLAAGHDTSRPSLAAAVLLLWVALVLYRVGRLGGAFVAARRLVKRSWPLPAAEEERLRQLVAGREADLPLRHAEIRIVVAPGAPATVGVWRRIVLLPEGFLTSAPADDAWAALAHELAHAQRHDYALNLLCELLLLPVSFHPATAAIRRRVAVAREVACDEAAVAVLGRRCYARSLLALAASAAGLNRPTHALSVSDDPRSLEVRMKQILDSRPRLRRGPAGASLAAAALLLAAAGTLATLFAVRAEAPPSDDGAAAAGSLAAFVGTWRGDWPADPKDGDSQRRPALELHVAPSGAIHEFWWRYEKAQGGTIEATKVGSPVTAYRVEGQTLHLTQHVDTFTFRNQPPALAVIEESLTLQGSEVALFRVLSNSYFEARAQRREAVPPPPPPILMKRSG
ncbi:MAG TPA: M56 family metallopeptidase [Thermoanaerobaculia bacterium]|jgi:beta-lactamase regulating signal transducer with metallopeptidase domain|nr:M56 family metallopeptidase [Thermoanaerobaculia bacterium]